MPGMNSSSEPTARMEQNKDPPQWSETELLKAYEEMSFKPVSHQDVRSILISFLAAYSGKFSPSCQLGELVKTAAILLPARRSKPFDWKAASDPKQLLFGDRFLDEGKTTLPVLPTTLSAEEIDGLKAGYQHELHATDALLRKRRPRKARKTPAPSPEENGTSTTTTTTSRVAEAERNKDPLSIIIEELQSTEALVYWHGRKKACFLAAVVSRLCVKTVPQFYHYIRNTARKSIMVYGVCDSAFPPLPHPSFLHQLAKDFKRNSPHQVELYTLLIGKYTLLRRDVEATATHSESRRSKSDEILLLNALCLASTSWVGLRMIPLLLEVLKKARQFNSELQIGDILDRAESPETLSSCCAIWNCLVEFAAKGKGQYSWIWCRLIRDSALPNLRIQDNPLLASMFVAFLAKADGDKSPLWEITAKKGVTAAHKAAGTEWAADYWSALETTGVRWSRHFFKDYGRMREYIEVMRQRLNAESTPNTHSND